ncbi:MAG: DUF3417 domain-containing protein [Lawsonella clevelandensis]
MPVEITTGDSRDPLHPLEELLANDRFRDDYERECRNLEAYMAADSWFQETHDPDATGRASRDPLTAYFSMEFGITPASPSTQVAWVCSLVTI